MTAADLDLLARLRLASTRGELSVEYQPQVAAADGAVRSVEALLRWTDPSLGRMSPGHFIPLAERTGLIGRITDWVLDEALDAQVRWRSLGEDLGVSVNVSAQTLNQPDLTERILAKLGERALPAQSLTVEVTETAVTHDTLQAVALLAPLREAGVRVSIDDFGAGYTSLAALPHLPLDELKVDQGFVRRCSASKADMAIVASVGELAHRLELTSVAEGVEDDATCERVIDLGYELIQGFRFARPMPEGDLLAYVAGSRRPEPDPAAMA